MTLSSAEIKSPMIQATTSEDEVRSAGTTTAAELLQQALAVLGQGLLRIGQFDGTVADYERRVAQDEPYEDTLDREEFRRRYGV